MICCVNLSVFCPEVKIYLSSRHVIASTTFVSVPFASRI